MADKGALLVVAIDFGTTYSGLAFQFKHEYDPKDPTRISTPQIWNDGHTQASSLKTPTCLLLNKFLKIDSFGYEADRKYTEVCLGNNDEAKNWYFYKHFKMKLQQREMLRVDSYLEDEGKKAMPAQKVFMLSIQCIKDKLMETLSQKKASIRDDDIRWVLTVPAIWDEAAKQFMRGAAIKAGIKSEHLRIALEPEAASMYCQFLPVEKFLAGSGKYKLSLATPGTVYMVVDLGGGTADITIHEKLKNGQLKEVHSACGGPWGGNAVDANFAQLLFEVFGIPLMTEMREKHKADYMLMMSEFEANKRLVEYSNEGRLSVKVPYELSELCKEERHFGKDVKSVIAESKYASEMKLVGDKIRINYNLVRTCLKKVTDNILDVIQQCVMDTKAIYNISLILMVGGFSGSAYVQEAVRQEFEEKNNIRVLIPEDAGLSVLKGAVIFGWQPETIKSRVVRYTYGAEITPIFDEQFHDDKHRSNDSKRCNNVFQPFIQKDKDVEIGYCVERKYNTIHPDQKTISLKIFCSDKIPGQGVQYTDDEGFRCIGTLDVEISQPTKDNQDILVSYQFGHTEMVVSGKVVKTGRNITTILKLSD